MDLVAWSRMRSCTGLRAYPGRARGDPLIIHSQIHSPSCLNTKSRHLNESLERNSVHRCRCVGKKRQTYTQYEKECSRTYNSDAEIAD